MPLLSGTRLGAYIVGDLIGAGGMGEVYRARDTRLKRDVALKTLPQLVASDPGRLARFQREAEVLASLNHPNIAHVHGLEESDGTQALVMEFVDGEPLSARIARGPVSVDEALSIARQIADAMEAAHERGVIHRDLNPIHPVYTADPEHRKRHLGLDAGRRRRRAADSNAGAGTRRAVLAGRQVDRVFHH